MHLHYCAPKSTVMRAAAATTRQTGRPAAGGARGRRGCGRFGGVTALKREAAPGLDALRLTRATAVRAAADPALARPSRLESDIATLEQHLGKMRAAYQLNAEKLEYNYRWAPCP